MEAFSLLKYWKRSASSAGGTIAKHSTQSVTVIGDDSFSDGVVDDDDDDDDDGPFIDLEFAVPDDVEEEKEVRQKVEKREIVTEIDDAEERDLIVQVDGSDTAAEIEEIIHSAADNSKSGQFPVTVSIAKSATKLRVFMSGLKRSKSENNQIPDGKIDSSGKNSKFMTVRLKMNEVKAPIKSLLTRAHLNSDKITQVDEKLVTDEHDNEDEKKRNNKKEVMQRYLTLVRPSHVKLSKRSNREINVAEAVVEAEVVAKGEKRRLNNLKVMAKKHLGKSKSAVVHSMPSSSNSNTTSSLSKKTSNDWLLQQQDGIQGAILHCKRSFNSSSSSSEGRDETASVLFRSTSNPSHENKFVVPAEAVEEEDGNGVVTR